MVSEDELVLCSVNLLLDLLTSRRFGQELDIVESGELVRDIFGFSDAAGPNAGIFVNRRHRSTGVFSGLLN